MKQHIYILLTLILTACGTNTTDKQDIEIQSNKIDTVSTDYVEEEDTTENEMATYFLVVADTNVDYYFLQRKMFAINRELKIPIDTMRRSYNKAKNLIALADNDEDDIYTGDYFPRRYPSESLSLEYLNLYQQQAGEKTIALVSGIYETEAVADSAMKIIQTVEKKAFKVKAEIYMGCMH